MANAGMVSEGEFLSLDPGDWDRTIALNLTGAFHTVQLAARSMKTQRRGSIVLTASTNSFDGEQRLTAYNASKAGLLGLLHTSANEIGPYGIRVNAVCPGLIRTRLTKPSFDNPAVIRDYFRHIALGRGGEPDEVARPRYSWLPIWLPISLARHCLWMAGRWPQSSGAWSEDTAEFSDGRWTLHVENRR